MILNNAKIVVACVGIASCMIVQAEKKLPALINEWQQTVDALPGFGVYTPVLDMTIIDRSTAVVASLLSQPHLTACDSQLILNYAVLVLHEPIYSDASARSKWFGYAKRALIEVLNASKKGQNILQSIAEKNALLQSEIEVYVQTADLDLR